VSFDGGQTWTAAEGMIHVEQAPDGYPPGDYNKDKTVDTADFVVWRRTLGHRGAGLAADGNWSGHVDEGDYDVVAQNFGQTANGAAANSTTATPEPGSVALLLVGMLPLLALRREYAA
jgi:hypothetical protein